MHHICRLPQHLKLPVIHFDIECCYMGSTDIRDTSSATTLFQQNQVWYKNSFIMQNKFYYHIIIILCVFFIFFLRDLCYFMNTFSSYNIHREWKQFSIELNCNKRKNNFVQQGNFKAINFVACGCIVCCRSILWWWLFRWTFLRNEWCMLVYTYTWSTWSGMCHFNINLWNPITSNDVIFGHENLNHWIWKLHFPFNTGLGIFRLLVHFCEYDGITVYSILLCENASSDPRVGWSYAKYSEWKRKCCSNEVCR